METKNNDRQELNTVLVNEIKGERKVADAALKWAARDLAPDQAAKVRDAVLEGGVKVRNIDRALHNNPAAAIFGESQVGKSYLVKNLLKDAQGGFSVKNPADGRDVNFLSELNPQGGGAESTSLITRFTVRPTNAPNSEYPIKAVIFSPMDVVLTLADSFFSDVKNHSFPDKENLETLLNSLTERYAGVSPVQSVLTAEDLYEMAAYLNPDRFPIARTWLGSLRSIRFFERLATLIAAVPASGWPELFSVLWNSNPIIDDIFRKLIALLRELDFEHEVYISVDALLSSTGTILSVDRIKEFFGLESMGDTKVDHASVPLMKVSTSSGVKEVKKSEFTSIAAEVVLEVPKEVADRKKFLNNLDILDFPGARSRENIDEHDINAERACTMVLRGRVAYLFNKYSRNYLITTLLFCYHNQQSNVKTLSELLRFWIEDMIGAVPEERAAYLSQASVPPLFIVGTKFNSDLNRNNSTEKDTESEENLQASARNRWENRFDKFLVDIIDGHAPESWYNNWTPGRSFDNLYLLRDYEWSTEVFGGYMQSNSESGVKEEMKRHMERLKDTFLSHPSVRTHFRDAAEAWRRSAEPNEDGSEYIIENLVSASATAVSSRNRRFEDQIRKYFHTLFDAMDSRYHDDDTATRIARTLRDAGRISFMFDTLFTSRPKFFSEFLSAMIVGEDKLHDKVLDMAGEISVVDRTDLRALLAIRRHAGIDPKLSRQENTDRLLKAYHASSLSEMEAYLQRYGYSLDDVINPENTQNLPKLLVEELERFWFDHYLNPQRLQSFKEYGLTDDDLEAVTASLKALYSQRLDTSLEIRSRIAKYVTTPDRLSDMADVIADIVSEMFNKFVNSFGTAYFNPELWQSVAETSKMADVEVTVPAAPIGEVEFDEHKSLQYMSDVFSTFEHLDELMSDENAAPASLEHFSNYRHYSQWAENMKIGFMASCDIPKFDIEKNERLRDLIVKEFTGDPAVGEMVETDPAVKAKIDRMKQALAEN